MWRNRNPQPKDCKPSSQAGALALTPALPAHSAEAAAPPPPPALTEGCGSADRRHRIHAGRIHGRRGWRRGGSPAWPPMGPRPYPSPARPGLHRWLDRRGGRAAHRRAGPKWQGRGWQGGGGDGGRQVVLHETIAPSVFHKGVCPDRNET